MKKGEAAEPFADGTEPAIPLERQISHKYQTLITPSEQVEELRGDMAASEAVEGYLGRPSAIIATWRCTMQSQGTDEASVHAHVVLRKLQIARCIRTMIASHRSRVCSQPGERSGTSLEGQDKAVKASEHCRDPSTVPAKAFCSLRTPCSRVASFEQYVASCPGPRLSHQKLLLLVMSLIGP